MQQEGLEEGDSAFSPTEDEFEEEVDSESEFSEEASENEESEFEGKLAF